MPSGEPRALAARTAAAVVWAYPLYAAAATRHHAVANAANPNRHPPNTLRHERSLSDHLARWITTPNNDTLYANAWVDLSAGPVQLQVQQMPAGRHWSVALLDAWTNHVAVVGQHVAACGSLTLNLAGTGGPAVPAVPSDGTGVPAAAGGTVVQAPGQDVWLLARCLVEGPQHLAAAHAMQDRLRLHGPATPPRPVPAPVPAVAHAAPGDAGAFLAVVNAVLAGSATTPRAACLGCAGWAGRAAAGGSGVLRAGA